METASKALTETQAAIYLNVSRKTLQARRQQRKAPCYVKAGKSIRYLIQDLDDYLTACRVDPARA